MHALKIHMDNKEDNPLTRFLQITQSIITILAIVIGGLWGLWIYYSTREAFHKIEVNHKVENFYLTDEKILLRISITVSNIGKGYIELGQAEIRVSQILPLADCDEDTEEIPCPKYRIEKNKNVIKKDSSVAFWPLLDSFKTDRRHLEPTEKDTIYFDMIVPSSTTLYQIYSYFPNPNFDNVGWKTLTIHKIDQATPQGERK
jgi:hypothetical protein